MKAKEQKEEQQLDIFGSELEFIVNLNHELCILAEKIDWKKFEDEVECIAKGKAHETQECN